MSIEFTTLSSVTGRRVFVAGEIDFSTDRQLRETLAAELKRGQTLELDLSRVTFMDASGIHLLHWLHGFAAERGAEVKVCAVSARAQQVFKIAQAERVLTRLQG